MELCFYRGTGVLCAIIRWWTKSPWAHVELRFTSGVHWAALMHAGTVWTPHIAPGLTLPVPCEAWEEQQLHDWCESECNCPYDWKGIFLAQLLNRARSTTDAWFCSESCTAALQVIHRLPVWLKPCTVNPGLLARVWQQVLSAG